MMQIASVLTYTCIIGNIKRGIDKAGKTCGSGTTLVLILPRHSVA